MVVNLDQLFGQVLIKMIVGQQGFVTTGRYGIKQEPRKNIPTIRANKLGKQFCGKLCFHKKLSIRNNRVSNIRTNCSTVRCESKLSVQNIVRKEKTERS